MPDTSVTNIIPKAAHEYFQKGYSVIPVKPNTKKPAIASWKAYQTRQSKELELAKWDTDYPGCNWAIVTGKVSGLVVLDFDTTEAEEKAKEFGLPDTATVKTPRGRHYYFKHPGGKVPSRTGVIEGMDVRGDGGYVVAPPSIVGEGARYKWEQGSGPTELADLPTWVLEKPAAEPVAPVPAQPQLVSEAPPTDPEKYALAALDRELEILATTPQGKRNVQLNKSAYSLGQIVATGALDRLFVELVLRRWALDRGLPAAEIATTIESGLGDGIQQPRWIEKSRFRLLTVEEIKAMPDPQWLIDGLIPQGALAVLYGDAEKGKSFLALDWACSIATGRHWFGRAVAKGPSIYVAAESPHGFKARIAAWEAVRGRLNGQPFRMLPRPVTISSLPETMELEAAIRASGIGIPKFIVIDTLARCFGGGDENVAKDMNTFVRGVDYLKEVFDGCSVMVLHHVGKHTSKGARGSTALRGACDTEMYLKGDGGSKICRTFVCEKQKDAAGFKDILLALCNVNLPDGVGLDGSAVFNLRPVPKKSPFTVEPSPQGPTNKNDLKAFEALKAAAPDGWTYTEWREGSGVRKGNFKNVRRRLVGPFVVKEGDRYRVADRFQAGSTPL